MQEKKSNRNSNLPSVAGTVHDAGILLLLPPVGSINPPDIVPHSPMLGSPEKASRKIWGKKVMNL